MAACGGEWGTESADASTDANGQAWRASARRGHPHCDVHDHVVDGFETCFDGFPKFAISKCISLAYSALSKSLLTQQIHRDLL